MTLAQFAIAAQANPRWILNASRRLGLQLHYDVDEARRLGLARVLSKTLGMRLHAAWQMAEEALARPDERSLVTAESLDGSVRAEVDVYRYLVSFTVALSLAYRHEPRARGRRPSHKRDAVEAARSYGIDISLIDAALRRTPGERLRAADANAEFVRQLRGSTVESSDPSA